MNHPDYVIDPGLGMAQSDKHLFILGQPLRDLHSDAETIKIEYPAGHAPKAPAAPKADFQISAGKSWERATIRTEGLFRHDYSIVDSNFSFCEPVQNLLKMGCVPLMMTLEQNPGV